MISNKDSWNPSRQFRENKMNLEYFTARIMSVTSATLELRETLSNLQDQMQETQTALSTNLDSMSNQIKSLNGILSSPNLRIQPQPTGDISVPISPKEEIS